MHIFEITIQHHNGLGWPIVVEQMQSGELPTRHEGMLSLPENWQAELLALTHRPQHYGKVLGQALFQESIRDAFMQARLPGLNTLRVLLVVEAVELKPLHWEWLCAPIRLGQQWDFLGLDQQVLLSRYLPSLTERRFPPIGRRDLKALIVVANPPANNSYKLAPFDAEATVNSIQTALGDIPCKVLANTSPAYDLPTITHIAQYIIEYPCTILHFVAHGAVSARTGETLVYLLDEAREIKPISGSEILSKLDRLQSRHGLPHFIFLSTCESAAPEAERAGALGGLAQRLVRELGVPAVIAMSQQVSIATAQTLTSRFYTRLRDHGEPDRALVETTTSLPETSDILVPALYGRLGGRPLFSDTEERDLTSQEITFGLEQVAACLPERAPCLVANFNQFITPLRAFINTPIATLSEAANQEFTQALAEINTICHEVLDMNFRGLALGQPLPRYDSRCPFPGLYAFQPTDQEFFFGRDPLIDQLYQKITHCKFLAILGASGSGKSSVVLAGLVPRFRQEQLTCQIITPGNTPLAQLPATLSPESVFIVDQFEELFTMTSEVATRREFINRLLALPCQIIITMRADFWGECAVYPHLKALMQDHQELIAPMNTMELRRAMEQQGATVGLRFEADLSHTILEAVQDEPGAMPLLQHLLQELWKRRHGKWLKTSEYRQLGGIQQAMAYTADTVYQQASISEQSDIQAIFLALTQVNTDNEAEYRDTRRRVLLSDLMNLSEAAPRVIRLVHQLANARLVMTQTEGEQTHVEVAHEALIRYWPRLRAWVQENRVNMLQHQQLRQEAQLWADNQRERSYLLVKARLDKVQKWVNENAIKLEPLEADFLQACIKARQEAKRQQFIKLAQRMGLLITAIIFSIGLVMYRYETGLFAPATIQWTSVSELKDKTIDQVAWGGDGTAYVSAEDSEGGYYWAYQTSPTTWVITKTQDYITNIVPDLQHPRVIYLVSGKHKHLGRSEDRGLTWQPLTISSTQYIAHLTLSPKGVLYAILGEEEPQQLYMSDDNGKNWRASQSPLPKDYITLFTWFDGYLWLGTTEGLWQNTSNDKWDLVSEEARSIATITAANSNHIRWAGGYSGTFQISGANEIQLIDTITQLQDMTLMGENKTVLVAASAENLYWARPDSKTLATLPLPPGVKIYQMKTPPQNQPQIWLGTKNGLYIGEAGAWLKEK